MSAETNERRDLDLTGITTAEIATFNGDLSIVAGAAKSRLEVSIGGNATYKVEQIGTLLYIVGKKQGPSYANSGVSLRLWLPAGLALKLATVSGAIQIEGGASKIEAATTKGPIETSATGTGDIRLMASSGTLKARGVNGTLRLTTSHGDIQLEDARGQIHVATSHGGIRLGKVAGQIRADTSHGEIRFEDITGQMRLATSNGEIRIAKAAGQIQAVTSNGNVRLDHVSFGAGSNNWVKTSNGTVEIRGVSAPDGLQIHAKGYKSQLQADLSGYAIEVDRDHLLASLPGTKPAKLEVVTTKKIAITTREA
jgi:hypothetical protein